MPRRRTRIRHRARRFAYHPIRRHKGLTPLRIIKWAIAIGAPVANGVTEYMNTKDVRHGAGAFLLNYIPVNIENQQIDTSRLPVGYGSLLFAWLFGKIAGRVLR